MKQCCSYQGCIWKRQTHPIMGHYLWTVEFTMMRLKKRWYAFKKSLTDFDYSQIDNVQVDGIDRRDTPDFSDAYIAAADYKGQPMSEEQLARLNDNSSYVYDCVINKLY